MRLLKSFGYALRGILTCLLTEQNFRIHITAVITVLIFARLYGLPLGDYPPILLCFGLVMAMEAMNTAIEHTVDLTGTAPSPHGKIAKDTAAAAVLLAALASVAVAITTFSDVERLLHIVKLFTRPVPILALIGYIAAFWCFVFLPRRKL